MVEIVDESHGSPGERIVECNLSYRRDALPGRLCAHHLPFSNWVAVLRSSEIECPAMARAGWNCGGRCGPWPDNGPSCPVHPGAAVLDVVRYAKYTHRGASRCIGPPASTDAVRTRDARRRER